MFNQFLDLNNISLDDDTTRIKDEIMNGIFPEEKKLLKYFKEKKYDKKKQYQLYQILSSLELIYQK